MLAQVEKSSSLHPDLERAGTLQEERPRGGENEQRNQVVFRKQ